MRIASNHGAPRARRSSSWRWVVCATFLLATPSALRAQRAAGPGGEAAAHFDRGIELYGEGNLDAALVEFERAHELVPSYRVLYNLAQIQAERHEYVAALGLFERYLEEGGAEVATPRKAETLEEIARLRTRIAELWVESDVSGAKLSVNGAYMGTLPLSTPILINPGVCQVRVEKPGYRAQRREIKVAGGDHARVELRLNEGGDPAPGSAADAASASAPQRNYRPFWISAATAVALGGATLTFGLVTQSADRTLDRELDRFPVNDRALADDRSRLKTYAALTDGFGAATIVALGFAVYFLIDP
ncbi:MAG TPA: PEGA domain-containing protein, partial [Polyangiaceae bacterium]|nr:PEGA domain-containing protein [Polyangiaceae bacterium]